MTSTMNCGCFSFALFLCKGVYSNSALPKEYIYIVIENVVSVFSIQKTLTLIPSIFKNEILLVTCSYGHNSFINVYFGHGIRKYKTI